MRILLAVRPILLFALVINIATFCKAEGENIMNSQTPSYKLGLIPSDYSTDPNTPLDIVVAVSGNGNVKKAKIMVYSDNNVSLNGQNNNLIIPVDPKTFAENEKVKKALDAKKPTHGITPLMSEVGEHNLVIKISLKSKNPGDHNVIFILSYSPDDTNWFTDRQEFKFHVNSFLDLYSGWLTVLGVALAFLALFFGVSAAERKTVLIAMIIVALVFLFFIPGGIKKNFDICKKKISSFIKAK